MKNRNTWLLLILLTVMLILDVKLISYDLGTARLNSLLTEDTMDTLRAQKIPLNLMTEFKEWEKRNGVSCYDYLCAWVMTGETKRKELEWTIQKLREHREEEFEVLTGYLAAVWEDLVYFPVPVSAVNNEDDVTFTDSWMYERSFGGKRGHEGCDIMADINERGRFPVVSMTDGVVEQVGWLTKGGYRIGIRAPHGGYFYYAHLYDYAHDFEPGETVKAGDLLGFMGDSGYSEIEGTVGNFDVHLHVGIYVKKPDGSEMSINPYGPLKSLETNKLTYIFD